MVTARDTSRQNFTVNHSGGKQVMMYQPPLRKEKKYRVSIDAGPSFPYHWHKELELNWCISGRVHMEVEGEQITANPGEVIFVNSAEEHRLEQPHADAEKMLIIVGEHMLGEELNWFLTHCCPGRVIRLDDGQCWTAELGRLLRLMLEEKLKGQHSPDVGWALQGYVMLVASLLCRSLPATDTVTRKRKGHLQYLQNVHVALNYIDRHFAEDISVSSVASVAGYERTSFCRVFKAATGLTFLQYLNNRRIDEAKYLLEGSLLTIREVGVACGMSQGKKFSRVFKQYCGMTPSEYRSESRQYNRKA